MLGQETKTKSKVGEQPTEYIGDILKEKESLDEQIKNTPLTIGNKHRRWRMQADI